MSGQQRSRDVTNYAEGVREFQAGVVTTPGQSREENFNTESVGKCHQSIRELLQSSFSMNT